MYGHYDSLGYDLQTHIIPHAKQVFADLGVLFIYLGSIDNYELDHVLKKPFREAFNIPTNQGYAVVVPKFLNSARTNVKPMFKYSLCDFRIRGPCIQHKMPSLFKLIQGRLWDTLD